MGRDTLSSRRRHHDDPVAALSDQGDMITLPTMDNRPHLLRLCTNARCRATRGWVGVAVAGRIDFSRKRPLRTQAERQQRHHEQAGIATLGSCTQTSLIP